MKESLSEFLDEQQLDMATLEEAMKLCVFQSTNYVPAEDMYASLSAYNDDIANLDSALAVLRDDVQARDALIIAFFEQMWDVPGGEEQIRSAVANAKTKAPIIELAVITTALLYGIWLLKTGGVKERRERRETRPDGTETFEQITVNYPFANPLRSFLERIVS
jgi:hypothetical protein